MSGWDFLRDEQNREALKLLGTGLAALVLAGWTVFQELRSRKRIREIERELADLKGAMADVARQLDNSRRDDLLFGLALSKIVVVTEAQSNDERSANEPL